MPFAVKLQNYQQNKMLNICDAELLGKNIVEGELTMNISENYYGEKFVEKEEAEDLLKTSSIINMVGENTVSLSIDLGIGNENGIKTISGVPFLIVFKM
ncbi:MAG: DUF424 domain-containing protein [Nitrosopumilus sp.]|jgi:hypothetical protein